MSRPYIPPHDLAEMTGDMGAVLPFPQRAVKLPEPHFSGYVYGRILKVLETGRNLQEGFTVRHVAQSHMDGSRTAHIQIAGDANVYELTLRPVGRAR